ncbi:MAG: [LysW]-lysine hydrolase [Chloroflexi bacterium]|nr:[LysW]-lysine hydrolase [Chloroflexota bacterium]
MSDATSPPGAALDDRAAIELLEALVRHYTPSTHEAPAVECLVAWMARRRYEACVDAAGNAVGNLGEGEKHLLLLGHIDTVPGEIPVRREGGALYGRGSVDAKGPLAAFVMAAARVGALPGLRVTVVGAVEEECAISKGAYHVVRAYPPANWVVIGEPSGWQRITLGYKGRLLVDYALEQSMAHTAGQQRGVCEQAVDYWLRVAAWAEGYNRDKDGAFATLDPSLREIRSDCDGLAERVTMTIGLRLPLGLDVPALEAQLAGWAGEARVTTRGHELPFRAEKRNPLTSAFLAAIRAGGGHAAFVTKTGTSDMNVIGPRWERPIVAYGPGDSSLDHTPNEHLALDEYLASIRVLERVIARLAQV